MRAQRLRSTLLVLTVGLLFPAVAAAQQTDSMKADSAAQAAGVRESPRGRW